MILEESASLMQPLRGPLEASSVSTTFKEKIIMNLLILFSYFYNSAALNLPGSVFPTFLNITTFAPHYTGKLHYRAISRANFP
jgi:hypothetical protein